MQINLKEKAHPENIEKQIPPANKHLGFRISPGGSA